MKRLPKLLHENLYGFIIDKDPVIPSKLIVDAMNSELKAVKNNSNTFWDIFHPDNVHRSNVTKKYIQKAQTERNVQRGCLSS